MAKADHSSGDVLGKQAGGPHEGDDWDADEGAVPSEASEASSGDRFPNMTAQRDMDRQEHIRRAEELGATREQATRHAEDEVAGHDGQESVP